MENDCTSLIRKCTLVVCKILRGVAPQVTEKKKNVYINHDPVMTLTYFLAGNAQKD